MTFERHRELQERLRSRIVRLESRQVLIAKLAASKESEDEYTVINCGGYGRVRKYTSFRLHMRESQRQFDKGFRGLLPNAEYASQVFQLAGCDLRCWYCFVDFELLAGREDLGRWFGASELLEATLKDASAPSAIDLTGGQSELVPEWTLWMMEEVERVGLRGRMGVWADDSLTCDFFWTKLSSAQRKYIRDYPGYSRAVCIKGLDPEGFQYNTGQSLQLFDHQLDLLRRLVEERFPLLIYLTMLDIDRTESEVTRVIDALFNRFESIEKGLSKCVVPLRISSFNNTLRRANIARLRCLGNQDRRFASWNARVGS